MSTTNPTQRKRSARWAVPAVALTAGIGYLIAGIVGGDLGFGIFGLVLMVGATVAALVLARYSETVAGLLDRRDERINGIDLAATAFAGTALIAAVIVMFIIEIARGHSGSPYYQLGALAGLAYLASLVYLRARR
jgi:hypothetical protein